jgi:L-lactate dehydrogenase complex protein LldG
LQDYSEALAKLAEIVEAEQIKKVMATTDDVISLLDLPSWGKENDVDILHPTDFEDRDSFKRAVFEEVQAGITGADYAIAESGTLVLAHDAKQSRLVSLAPITHIAVVPVERLRPVYEHATDEIFGERENVPSQVSFITGPSMTGDIQGVPFKGMHGPKKLFVILVG